MEHTGDEIRSWQRVLMWAAYKAVQRQADDAVRRISGRKWFDRERTRRKLCQASTECICRTLRGDWSFARNPTLREAG
jgi:hypothetical protein